ncbi:ATP-dependent DNA ligase [Kribbella sp. CWNU-51]
MADDPRTPQRLTRAGPGSARATSCPWPQCQPRVQIESTALWRPDQPLTTSKTAGSSDRLKISGELVILGADGRVSFDALQQRLVTSPAKARAKAAELPASFAAFDLLAAGGVDLRTQRWAVRRERLEQVSRGWAPLQLTPVTTDLDEATEWFEVLPAAMGVEGRS